MDDAVVKLRNKTFNEDLKNLIADIVHHDDSTDPAHNDIIKDESLTHLKVPFYLSKLDYAVNENLVELLLHYLEFHSEFFLRESVSAKDNALQNQDGDEIIKKIDLDSDIFLYDILVDFWSWLPQNIDRFIRNIFSLFFAAGEFLHADASAFHVYSQRDTLYFPLFYNEISQEEILDFIFIPKEELILSFVQLQQPIVLSKNEIDQNPLLRKRIPDRFYSDSYTLIVIPLFGQYRNLKPKNLILLSFFISAKNKKSAEKRLFALHQFLEFFFPVVDFLRLFEKDYHAQSQVVDQVYNFLRDRRAYPTSESTDEWHRFHVIKFAMRSRQPDQQNVRFKFLIAQLQKDLSFQSKIIQHSYDKAYVILTGEDTLKSGEIFKKFSESREIVEWQEKVYPDFGRNIYNYQ